MPTVEMISREEIHRRRKALLAEACMPEAELRRRGAVYALDARESGILDEIDGLDFLLGK